MENPLINVTTGLTHGAHVCALETGGKRFCTGKHGPLGLSWGSMEESYRNNPDKVKAIGEPPSHRNLLIAEGTMS
jgi:hypothetical protein